jgi:uncharacterized repeat protein (TIGR03803 family)
VFCGFLSLVLSPSAQTLVTFSLHYPYGQTPVAPLVQATDGNLYGTGSGIFEGPGTVFRITPSGTLTLLHTFAGADGWNPTAGLVQATNGDFYGTTSGIDDNCEMPCPQPSTIFKITPTGTLTTLLAGPTGTFGTGLVQATDGNFYGTSTSGNNGQGSVFKITGGGQLTTLHSFCPESGCPDGATPVGVLIQGTDGYLYGTTAGGGAHGGGTVFKITTGGKLTTLYSFCSQGDGKCTDGTNPAAGLIQATSGNFYGTTSGGGTGCGPAGECGTIFEITPSGKLTTLYNFAGGADGFEPQAGLVQASDGNFYGTVSKGGSHSQGTVFRITAEGSKLSTLYSFCSQAGCADGANPIAAVVQDTNGSFYGTTENGGVVECRAAHMLRSIPCGTIFRLSVGLKPFVKMQPAAGKVGAEITILGTALTDATRVSFNGTAATFTIVSGSEIKTTVPAGAATGSVTVATSAGTLTSNIKFLVTP